MVNLTVLGSTGSIGCSTLDVVRRNRNRFRVYSLVAGRNLPVLLSQIKEFLPKVVVVADDELKNRLASELAGAGLFRGALSGTTVVVARLAQGLPGSRARGPTRSASC